MSPSTQRSPTTTDAAAPIEQDEDDSAAEHGPQRRCAVTRERGSREAMIRFVVSPDRVVVADLAASLPGRGIWLSARADVIQRARTKGAFARAARSAVTVPPDLLSGLIAALERRISDHIGLARRAGQAVAGFDKAREWLEAGRAVLVVQAADGSPEERARFLGRHAGAVPVVAPLAAARLGMMFGRERAVHVVVSAGRLAERLQTDAGRLAGLRGPERPASTVQTPAGTASVTTGDQTMERDQAGR